MRLCFNSTRRA